MKRAELVLPWEEDERVRGERSRWVVFFVFLVVILGIELFYQGIKGGHKEDTDRGAEYELCSVQEMRGGGSER